jgi:hypothetical protein
VLTKPNVDIIHGVTPFTYCKGKLLEILRAR